MTIPLMTEALGGLTQQGQFAKILKRQLSYNTVESIENLHFVNGSFQPIQPRKLLIKPEGQRRWKWITVFINDNWQVDNYVLGPDIIEYRVMSKNDWSQAGYFEYDIVQSSDVGSQAP